MVKAAVPSAGRSSALRMSLGGMIGSHKMTGWGSMASQNLRRGRGTARFAHPIMKEVDPKMVVADEEKTKLDADIEKDPFLNELKQECIKEK